MNDEPKPLPKPQLFGTTEVRIKKTTTGERFAEIVPFGRYIARFHVPVGMCALAAGKDAWMRDILVRCKECRTKTRACDLEGDELCPKCYAKAEAEIEEGNK